MGLMKSEETIDWKELYFQLLDKLASFESEAEALRQKNEDLEIKVKELEEKLNTNSRNSSKPPSRDPFRPKNPKKSSGRTQGAQPGHKREMYSMDQVEKVVDLRPNTCSVCGFSNFKKVPVSVECRQTVEIPETIFEVTQYNIHTSQCSQCGKKLEPRCLKKRKEGLAPA